MSNELTEKWAIGVMDSYINGNHSDVIRAIKTGKRSKLARYLKVAAAFREYAPGEEYDRFKSFINRHLIS